MDLIESQDFKDRPVNDPKYGVQMTWGIFLMFIGALAMLFFCAGAQYAQSKQAVKQVVEPQPLLQIGTNNSIHLMTPIIVTNHQDGSIGIGFRFKF